MRQPPLGVVTDKAMADLFAEKARDRVRWDPISGRWLAYDGNAWRPDHRGYVLELAKQIVIEGVNCAVEEGDSDLALKLLAFHRAKNLSAMLKLSQSVPGVPALPEEFDRNGWLFNTQSHTIDLRTGAPRPHDPADMLTKVCGTGYDPAATCPVWLSFLHRIFGGDQALIGLMKRIFGYSLVGAVREHVFIVLWGTGANGKTTLTHVLLKLVGDYGMAVRPEIFLDGEGDPQGFGLADLPGVRVIVGSEISPGRRKLNESLVKSLTGRDRIRAAHKYGRPFEFEPVFKPILATNHKPAIEGQDHAIWRRMKLVPFSVTISDAEQDTELPDKLAGELPGIMNWALEGCYEWQQKGLEFPNEVTQATAEYRAEQDELGGWIEACCVIRSDVTDEVGALYADYAGWCRDHTETPISMKRFGAALDDKGIVSERGAKGKRRRRGVRRLSVTPVSEAGDASLGVTHPQSYSPESPIRAREGDLPESGSRCVTRHPPEIPWAEVDEALGKR